MACRIGVCWQVYIHQEVFKNVSNLSAIRSLLPKTRVLLVYLASFVLCWNINEYFERRIYNFIVGGGT
jgi:hypothetical protein